MLMNFGVFLKYLGLIIFYKLIFYISYLDSYSDFDRTQRAKDYYRNIISDFYKHLCVVGIYL